MSIIKHAYLYLKSFTSEMVRHTILHLALIATPVKILPEEGIFSRFQVSDTILSSSYLPIPIPYHAPSQNPLSQCLMMSHLFLKKCVNFLAGLLTFFCFLERPDCFTTFITSQQCLAMITVSLIKEIILYSFSSHMLSNSIAL